MAQPLPEGLSAAQARHNLSTEGGLALPIYVSKYEAAGACLEDDFDAAWLWRCWRERADFEPPSEEEQALRAMPTEEAAAAVAAHLRRRVRCMQKRITAAAYRGRKGPAYGDALRTAATTYAAGGGAGSSAAHGARAGAGDSSPSAPPSKARSASDAPTPRAAAPPPPPQPDDVWAQPPDSAPVGSAAWDAWMAAHPAEYDDYAILWWVALAHEIEHVWAAALRRPNDTSLAPWQVWYVFGRAVPDPVDEAETVVMEGGGGQLPSAGSEGCAFVRDAYDGLGDGGDYAPDGLSLWLHLQLERDMQLHDEFEDRDGEGEEAFEERMEAARVASAERAREAWRARRANARARTRAAAVVDAAVCRVLAARGYTVETPRHGHLLGRAAFRAAFDAYIAEFVPELAPSGEFPLLPYEPHEDMAPGTLPPPRAVPPPPPARAASPVDDDMPMPPLHDHADLEEEEEEAACAAALARDEGVQEAAAALARDGEAMAEASQPAQQQQQQFAPLGAELVRAALERLFARSEEEYVSRLDLLCECVRSGGAAFNTEQLEVVLHELASAGEVVNTRTELGEWIVQLI